MTLLLFTILHRYIDVDRIIPKLDKVNILNRNYDLKIRNGKRFDQFSAKLMYLYPEPYKLLLIKF